MSGTSSAPRRPLIGWSKLLTPAERRRICGPRKQPHPRVIVQQCCLHNPPRRRKRRRLSGGLSAQPHNAHEYTRYLTHISDARGIPHSVLKAAVDSGQLPAVKAVGSWWVRFVDLNAWQARYWDGRGR